VAPFSLCQQQSRFDTARGAGGGRREAGADAIKAVEVVMMLTSGYSYSSWSGSP
jgi:hypothetical protein